MPTAIIPQRSHKTGPGETGAGKRSPGAGRLAAVIGVSLVLFGASLSTAFCQAVAPSPGEPTRHISLGLGPVYNLHEERFFPGLGFEFEQLLPFGDRRFGIGVAAEMAFDKHKHYVVSLLACYHPVEPLTLCLAPGVMLIDHDRFESRAALHFGVEYEFEVGGGSLAPSVEAAVSGDDVHLMLGVHVGFGF